MDSRELLQVIRGDIKNVKEKGVSTIPLDLLLEYVDALEKESGESRQKLLPEELEEYKARLQDWQLEKAELFKSVILTGQNALKSAVLINGGAAVALLAFIGHVWKAADGDSALLKLLAAPLVSFVAGVLLAAVAAGTTYLSQLCYASHAESRGGVFKTGVALHVATVLFVFAAYAAFAYATCLVYGALIK